MLPEPVRTELAVSGAERTSDLLVSAGVSGSSAQLPTRVCHQRRVSPHSGLHEPQVPGPLSRRVWSERAVHCAEPQPDLPLQRRLSWRSIHRLSAQEFHLYSRQFLRNPDNPSSSLRMTGWLPHERLAGRPKVADDLRTKARESQRNYSELREGLRHYHLVSTFPEQVCRRQCMQLEGIVPKHEICYELTICLAQPTMYTL